MEQKETQVKITTDNFRKIYELEKETDLLNQTIGELRASKQEFRNKLDDKSKDEKVLTIIKTITKKNHPFIGDMVQNIQSETSYKNLDNVIDTIRKEESKKLKLDNESLEAKLDDAEIKVSKTERKLEKEEASVKERITEAKDKLKELHKRDTVHYDKEIEGLKKTLNEVKANKTDKEIEAKRKQEIIDLKEEITMLNIEIKDLSSINFIKRSWRKFTNYYATKDAIVEKEEKEDRIKEISNNYPKGHSFWDRFNEAFTPGYTNSFGYIG